MFYIANFPQKWLDQNIGGFYFTYSENVEVIQGDDYTYIFDGALYHDNKFSHDDLIGYFRNHKIDHTFKKFTGKYSGVFIDMRNDSMYLFNDQLGLRDLFYYQNEESLIVSNSFAQIVNNNTFSSQDIDETALIEFLTFEHPLFDNTFLKSVKLLPLASIFYISGRHVTKSNYWEYRLNESSNFKPEEAVEQLDEILNTSFDRIKGSYGANTQYGLGLSGGLDSRLVAYYALRNGLSVKSYVFGEPGSGAYDVSAKIAKKLNLDHYEVGINREFVQYSQTSLEFDPMANVQYAWYYGVYESMPPFNVLLTGFNGDNQFGSHLITNNSISSKDLVKLLMKKYAFSNEMIIGKIDRCRIEQFLDDVDGSTINKWENFNYQFRQLKFIKNSAAFNFFGRYESVSPFEDIDFVEFMLKVPYSWKKDIRFHKYFQEHKISDIAKIRPERESIFKNRYLSLFDRMLWYLDTEIFETNLFYKKSHKRLHSWLKGNDLFYNYCADVLVKSNNKTFLYNLTGIDLEKELTNVYEGRAGKPYLFFRILSVDMFLQKHIT